MKRWLDRHDIQIHFVGFQVRIGNSVQTNVRYKPKGNEKK